MSLPHLGTVSNNASEERLIMSKQGIAAFLDRLETEADFRGEVGRTLQGATDTGAATVALARGEGFDFTKEEFDQALVERYADRELNDDELDQATGAGVTVGVNYQSVLHKTWSGVLIAFPDVCKTPAPGGPIPIPYPTTSDGDTTGTKDTGSIR